MQPVHIPDLSCYGLTTSAGGCACGGSSGSGARWRCSPARVGEGRSPPSAPCDCGTPSCRDVAASVDVPVVAPDLVDAGADGSEETDRGACLRGGAARGPAPEPRPHGGRPGRPTATGGPSCSAASTCRGGPVEGSPEVLDSFEFFGFNVVRMVLGWGYPGAGGGRARRGLSGGVGRLPGRGRRARALRHPRYAPGLLARLRHARVDLRRGHQRRGRHRRDDALRGGPSTRTRRSWRPSATTGGWS